MFGKHGAPTCLSQLNWKFRSVVPPFKFNNKHDSWPCNMESGWAAHYGRLDITFEAMCQHLVQNQFTSDAFQGDSNSYLFQWDTNVWGTFFFASAFRPVWPGRCIVLSLSLCTTSDSRPGPGGSRTAASCRRQARRPSAIPLYHSAG